MKKYNILVPLAGKGQRMVDGGYVLPKPMILAGDRHIIDYSLGSIDYSESNLIFVIRRDHVCNFSIDKALQGKFGDDIQFIVADQDTRGSVESCLLAKNLINNDTPLIIFTPDIYFEPKFKPTDDIFEHEGFLLTFKANSANYSYIQHDADGYASRTTEKIVISDDAAVGAYCFQTGKTFVSAAEKSINSDLKEYKEFYICPLYNHIIAAGGKVKTRQVPIMYIMGTPDEMQFFKDVVYPYFLPRSFILCADHSGYDLKETTKIILKEKNIHYVDCGCYSDDNCDYSDYVNQAIETRRYYPGALILGFCRSGQGVNICANKHQGIRGVLVSTRQNASLGIRHNAANFFSIPAGATTTGEIKEIINTLMIEKFEGGRHQNRLQKGFM